jgi:hypothetical protein
MKFNLIMRSHVMRLAMRSNEKLLKKCSNRQKCCSNCSNGGHVINLAMGSNEKW